MARWRARGRTSLPRVVSTFRNPDGAPALCHTAHARAPAPPPRPKGGAAAAPEHADVSDASDQVADKWFQAGVVVCGSWRSSAPPRHIEGLTVARAVRSIHAGLP